MQFSNISDLDLVNAVNNIDFLLTRSNVPIELYDSLIRFRNNVCNELNKRGVRYG